MFYRITRILGHVMHGMYSTKPLPPNRLFPFVNRVRSDLREWKAQLPSFLGAINPSSLAPPFRRQATVLRLAYSHVVIHVTRHFLAGNIGKDSDSSDAVNEQISDCISTARLVLEIVDTTASDDPLFQTLWWTHFITFCALAVVYIWGIQHQLSRLNLYTQDYQEQLFALAEKCQTHLAKATASNSPGRRYSIILKELQAEAKRATAAPTSHSIPERQQNDRPVSEWNDTSREEEDLNVRRHSTQSGLGLVDVEKGAELQHNLWDNWQTRDWLEIDSLVRF